MLWAVTALDFVKVDEEGNIYRRTGKKLSDFYAYGSPVVACADGKVIRVIDAFADFPVRSRGVADQANIVAILHTYGEHTEYGHLKMGSITVKVGDQVRKGQQIGRIGNSGNSGIPHLHFTTSIQIWMEKGRGSYVSVPYQFDTFRLVRAFGTPCDVQVKRARPQEGWTMVFPGR